MLCLADLPKLLFKSCLILPLVFKVVSAGSCWMTIGNNDRCQGLILTEVSKENCCEGGSANMAWTPHENVDSGQLFFWRVLSGGAPDCQRCQETCSDVVCPDSMACRMRRGQPKCVCAPDCSGHSAKHKGQVCGTDGRTYRNYCSMLKYNCRHNQQIDIDYFGSCKKSSCDNVTCDAGQNCVVDQNDSPHCVNCIKSCPTISPPRPMCGADHVTYDNRCEIYKAACLAGKAILIAYNGPCQKQLTCDELECSSGKKCVTDPLTRRPQCIECHETCAGLTAAGQLCGTDGNTYENWCALRQESCRSGELIKTKHNGSCHAGLQNDGEINESWEYYDADGSMDTSENK